ncbi:acyl-CoA thioesterase [Vagococcus sp. PNs007]|uniref:Acyl-CoA thioesterase n=1 Tax=Vagococcus proximus TaxID=2991417 RepID=A0ABT5WY42_9ENTE|nr:acyl-CoA thioesterase [Vagococcus proximus]MDF0478677.1 acyl-CoA thioesterase [Vagococcus proximus]
MEQMKVTQTRLVLPADTNAHNTLFGGKLMNYIDDSSAIAAVRYARRLCVTASTDSVDFLHPINANHSVTLEAFISGSGKRSLEVFCKITGESLATGQTYLAATAFSTFVIVDDNPEPLEKFKPMNSEERLVHEGYEKRRKFREARRTHHKVFVTALLEQDK